MYKPETTLSKKDPYPEGDEKFPLNELRVIGQSNISSAVRSAEWEGQLGSAVTVQPVEVFGPTVDLPQGELQRDYAVVTEPEDFYQDEQRVRVIRNAGPSPEEQFAAGTAPVATGSSGEIELTLEEQIEKLTKQVAKLTTAPAGVDEPALALTEDTVPPVDADEFEASK